MTFTTERYAKALEGLGATISNVRTDKVFGTEIFDAVIETSGGNIEIVCGMNGTARVDKPNGTHKWYYEKSPAQIRRAVEQIKEFYR